MERTLAILFGDLSGYTALTEAHGDASAADVADRFYAITRTVIEGRAQLVKTIGDAVMVVAPAVEPILSVALDLAAAVEREPAFPMLRAGLHAGVAIERDGDYFGAAVNLAARVAAHAQPGQILCTAPVARETAIAATSVGFVSLKNVSMPVELFAIVVPGATAAPVHIDPICRMVVDAATAAAALEHEGRPIYFCSLACAERFRKMAT